jgi:tetratricopeptide (TPR) repeat protein
MAKQNYVRLAQALLKEHKYDSVIEVLDRGIELFPNNKFPFDYFMISWADFYYKAGAIEKADELVNQIEDRYNEDLAYYNSLNGDFTNEYQEDIQEAIAVMQRLIQVTSQNNQEERSKELEKTFYEHLSTFNLR